MEQEKKKGKDINKNKKNINKGIALSFIILSVSILILLVIGSLKGGFFTFLDNKVYTWNSSVPKPMIPVAMMLVSDIMSPGGVIILGFLAVFALLGMKRHRQAFLFVIGIFVCYILTEIIKAIVQKPRPEVRIAYASGFSFPSAHAAMAVFYFGMLILLFKDDIKSKIVRAVFIATCAFLALLISYSRIYLGVHWLSDVVCGMLLGLVLVISMSMLQIK